MRPGGRIVQPELFTCVSSTKMQVLPVWLWSNVRSDLLNNAGGNRRLSAAMHPTQRATHFRGYMNAGLKTSPGRQAKPFHFLLIQLIFLPLPLIVPFIPCCMIYHSILHSLFRLRQPLPVDFFLGFIN